MGRCEDSEIMKLLMHIGTGAFGLNAAFETSIVPTVGHILDL